MILINKKGVGGIGTVIVMVVSLIFFFSTYPFWQSMFTEAAAIHTGFIAIIITAIPFLVLLIIIVRVINFDIGGPEPWYLKIRKEIFLQI